MYVRSKVLGRRDGSIYPLNGGQTRAPHGVAAMQASEEGANVTSAAICRVSAQTRNLLEYPDSRAAGTIFHMTASPTNANDAARVLEEAGKWKAIADSAEMSEKQRLEFHAWLDEPRNGSALAEVQALVTLIQHLPEKKAAALRKQRLPLRSIELDQRSFLTKPLTAVTVAAAAVSAGAGAFGLSATLANLVEDLFWSGSSASTAMHSGAAIAVCCGAGLAGSVWAALFFRRAMSN
jgi:hypothetical protein